MPSVDCVLAVIAAARRHLWLRPAEIVAASHLGVHCRAPCSFDVVDTFPKRCRRQSALLRGPGFSSVDGCPWRSTACNCPNGCGASRSRCCSPTWCSTATRHVGREELIGALWPNQAPVSQDAALRTLLSRLRSSLGSASAGRARRADPSLPEPVWIDIEAAAAEMARALRGARARRRAPGLGARPGAAEHRQPRAAAGRAGELARAAAARARGGPPNALEVIGRAGLVHGRHAAAIGRAGGADADRGRALPGVRLRAADGGARRARATSPRRCAYSTGCAPCSATSSGRCPSARGDRRRTSGCCAAGS